MRKWFALFLVLVIALGLLAGCSKTEVKKIPVTIGTNDIKGDIKEKLNLEIMTSSFQGGGWQDDAIIIKKLNEKLNINLKMQWVPNDVYKEKINILAASNSFSDSVKLEAEEFNKWKGKNLFLDVKPFLKDYPNLVKFLGEDGYKSLNPKGKYFGLPYYNVDARDPLMVRKDWLDKLNLKMPETIDDFYNVAKSFVNNDPDGNGKKDTIGFSFSIGANYMISEVDHIAGAFGVANKWKMEKGQLIPMQVQTKEWKDTLTFLRKAFEEGVLDKDFVVNKGQDSLNKLQAGKLGINYTNPFQVLTDTIPSLKKIHPNAELVQIVPPKGPTGLQYTKTFDVQSKLVINSNIDVKKQQRLLMLYDYMVSDEGADLIKHGIEGVHFKKVGDNKFEVLEAYESDRPYLMTNWLIRRFDPMIQIKKWDDQQKSRQVESFLKTNEKYKQENPAAGLDSPTNVKLGKALQQKWTEIVVKIISGVEPVSAMDKAVEDWKKNGGDNIIKEINEEYQKLQ